MEKMWKYAEKGRLEMSSELKTGIGIFIAVLVVTTAISWISMGNEFFLYKFFVPKQEVVRREVFENTKSYKQGIAQEIQSYQVSYIVATDEQKIALGSLILHKIADYDESTFKPEIRVFLSQVRSDQANLKLKGK